MRRVSRRASAVTVTGLVCFLVAAPAPASGDGPPAGSVETQWGPLSPADKDMLIRVRLAALWQVPAGALAKEHAGSERITQIGAQVCLQQKGLDGQDERLAGKLTVALPEQPADEQQGWLRDLERASGNSFDNLLITRLRQAQSRLLPVLTATRANTRNDLVRDFAQTAINTVLTHMTLVESSGLVNFSAVPAIVTPQTSTGGSGAGQVAATAGDGIPLSPGFVLGLLVILVVATAVLSSRARSGVHSHATEPNTVSAARSHSTPAPSRTSGRTSGTHRRH